MSSGASPSAVDQAEPSHRVMQQAAEWYALLSSEDVIDGDRERWRAWLDDDPAHRNAWRRLEAIRRRFEPLQSTPDPRRTSDELLDANKRVNQRRTVLKSLVGTGVLGWAVWHYTQLPLMVSAWQADHHTITGETRRLQLADGSRIWLNTATALQQRFDARMRGLQLLSGEILVETASDPSRPFTVETPDGRLRALGTRFTVRLYPEHTLLAVYEGAVEILTREGAKVTLNAGHQTRFTAATPGISEPADPAREAWIRGVLVAKDITLREMVEELRRYRNGHLGLAPEIESLRVYGSFPLADTDAALDLLAAALPVRIQRTLPWWVSIEAAE